MSWRACVARWRGVVGVVHRGVGRGGLRGVGWAAWGVWTFTELPATCPLAFVVAYGGRPSPTSHGKATPRTPYDGGHSEVACYGSIVACTSVATPHLTCWTASTPRSRYAHRTRCSGSTPPQHFWGFGVIATDSIHAVVPQATRYPQRRGIVAHQSVLPMQTTRILGAPCLPAARCAIDLAKTLSRRDALPVLDAALFAEACDHNELLTELKLHDGLRGVRQARELVPLADPRAQCKQESQLRLIICDAGLVGFEPQLPVFDKEGHCRYYLDLGNPHTKVAAEYDGSSHLDRARLQSDRSRHNWLETHGWHLRYFTARDLYTTPHAVPPPSAPPPPHRAVDLGRIGTFEDHLIPVRPRSTTYGVERASVGGRWLALMAG